MARRQPLVHHAKQAVNFVGVALQGVLITFFFRVVAKMARLPGHRTKARHLPEQPLIHFDTLAFVGGIELAGLATQILQDRAGLEDRDGLSARPIRIDDDRHAVVGSDLEEAGLELFALADIHRLQNVGELALLKHHADLPAIRRRPIVKFDGSRRALGGLGGLPDLGLRRFRRAFLGFSLLGLHDGHLGGWMALTR